MSPQRHGGLEVLLWEDWTEESVLARKRDMDEGSKSGWQARALMTAEAVIRRWMCGARGIICFLLVLSAVVSFLDAAVPLRCGGVGFADLGVLCLLTSVRRILLLVEVHRLAHARTCSAEGEEKGAKDYRICYARLFWACPRGNTQLPDKKGSVDDWSPPTLRWGDFGMAVKDREVTMEGTVRSGGNERKYCISRLGHLDWFAFSWCWTAERAW